MLAAKNEGLEGNLLTFTMLAYTGVRIGEMIALKWADIDFMNKTLRVYKTYYNPTNNKLEYKLLTPKTESSVRTQACRLTNFYQKIDTKRGISHEKAYHFPSIDSKISFGR